MQKERMKNCRRAVLFSIGWLILLLGTAWLAEKWRFGIIGILIFILGIVVLFIADQTKPNTPLLRKSLKEKFCRSLVIREGIKKDDLWKVTLDVISSELETEVMKRKKGYLRTLWKIKYRKLDSNSDEEKYRSRIILKFRHKSWRKLRIKCESQYWGKRLWFGMTRKAMEKTEKEWIKVYDTELLDSIYMELKRRIGVVETLQSL
jgi:hypothetical protein